jgi:CheY-like chemotaxis protein
MRRRILLADDSVTIQKVIELTFLDEDYEVKAVSNGDEAIAALPQVSPDFVIADVHMPGANGYEVCRRSKEMRPEVPVLLLVGTFEPFDEGQSRAVGADSFLKKPFDSQELLQRVEDLLAARSGVGASGAGASAAVPPPPSNDDFLAMPALSELPPIDLDPSPSPFAAPPPSPTDWGSFQLEPTVDAIAEPADPFPASDPFPEPAPFPAPAPYPARAESSFDDSPFQLDAEPLAGDAFQVDESALLPAGEPLFELDSELNTEPEVIEDFGDTGLRAGEFGDATPALETPSFDSFDSPSFETPSYETPSFQTPSFEQPSYTAPSFETPSFETPAFEPPPLGFATTPEERLGVPQGAVPLVESHAELEARIEAPPPPSLEVSHEPESTVTPAAAPPAATNGGGRLSDEDVDRIARRVVELMADKAIRDVAWEVIPDMAEVVIRDRLRELESQAESFE